MFKREEEEADLFSLKCRSLSRPVVVRRVLESIVLGKKKIKGAKKAFG